MPACGSREAAATTSTASSSSKVQQLPFYKSLTGARDHSSSPRRPHKKHKKRKKHRKHTSKRACPP
eukprot:1194828-Pyramimonas_sp.AAC.1